MKLVNKAAVTLPKVIIGIPRTGGNIQMRSWWNKVFTLPRPTWDTAGVQIQG